MITKPESVVDALKSAILNLQDEIEIAIESWKDQPLKNKIGANWNPNKTDWRK
jgi:hypothetical protein